MPSATVYQFGSFRFDAGRRALWRGPDMVSIAPKALDLLAALIEGRGDLVTKDELLRKVWPDAVVEEANLSVNVSVLRKMLGKQPDGRPWITTVSRRGYRFLGAVTACAIPLGTLAVLPFRPFSPSETDDWLGLGMADALITRLSSSSGLVVRPTSAIRRFQSPEVDPLEAGRQLRVDAVLDARMQREGARLRLTVQLVPVDGSAPLWADTFEEESTHLFALEDAIAERLGTALLKEFSDAGRETLSRRQTESIEAYRAYCRGRFFWGRFTPAWLERAVRCFIEAAAHDRRYALPHAGLADAYLIAGFSGALTSDKAWALARAEAERALELNDRIPEAQVALAFLDLFESWNWEAAERALDRALALGPHIANTQQWWAFFLMLRGRLGEASSALARAEELDPLSPAISAFRGFLCSLEQDHARGLEQQKRTVELDPHQFLGHWAMGIANQNFGRFEDAVAAHRRALELSEDADFIKPVLARSLALAGRSPEARQILLDLEKPKAAWVSTYQLATVWLSLGDEARAVDGLRRACEMRDPWVVLLGVDPMLQPLRGQPAFQELLRRVGHQPTLH